MLETMYNETAEPAVKGNIVMPGQMEEDLAEDAQDEE